MLEIESMKQKLQQEVTNTQEQKCMPLNFKRNSTSRNQPVDLRFNDGSNSISQLISNILH